jgi:hypothetical protein
MPRPPRCGQAREGEQLDQCGSLAVAEAGDRLCVGDLAARQRSVDPARADLGKCEEKVAQHCVLGACGRVVEQACELDPSGGEFALQLGALATHLVRFRERLQSLLARARRLAGCPVTGLHGELSLRAEQRSRIRESSARCEHRERTW